VNISPSDNSAKQSIIQAMKGIMSKGKPTNEDRGAIADAGLHALVASPPKNTQKRNVNTDKITKLLNNDSALHPQPLSYDELLRLSFYEIDFDEMKVIKIKVGTTSFDFKGKLPPTIPGHVEYSADDTAMTTNARTWNTTFQNFTDVRFT
jgi:hypothetical protein